MLWKYCLLTIIIIIIIISYYIDIKPFSYKMDIKAIANNYKGNGLITSNICWNGNGFWNINYLSLLNINDPKSIKDIKILINDANINNKTISSRSGGHCYNNSSIQGNYILKFTKNILNTQSIYLDINNNIKRFYVDNSIRLGDIYLYIHNYNKINNRSLFIPGGTCSTVGIGGFLLGGGHGLLEPYYGSLCHLLESVKGVDSDGNYIRIDDKGLYDLDENKYIDYNSKYICAIRGAGHNIMVCTQYILNITSLPEHNWSYKKYYLKLNNKEKYLSILNNCLSLLNNCCNTNTPYICNGKFNIDSKHPIIEGGSPSELKHNINNIYEIELLILYPNYDLINFVDNNVIKLSIIENILSTNEFKLIHNFYDKEWYYLWYNYIGEFWDISNTKYSVNLYYNSLIVENSVHKIIEYNDLPDRFDFMTHINEYGLYFSKNPHKMMYSKINHNFSWPIKNVKYVLQIFSYHDFEKTLKIKNNFIGNKYYFNYPPSLPEYNNKPFIIIDGDYKYDLNYFYDKDKIFKIVDSIKLLNKNKTFENKLI